MKPSYSSSPLSSPRRSGTPTQATAGGGSAINPNNSGPVASTSRSSDNLPSGLTRRAEREVSRRSSQASLDGNGLPEVIERSSAEALGGQFQAVFSGAAVPTKELLTLSTELFSTPEQMAELLSRLCRPVQGQEGEVEGEVFTPLAANLTITSLAEILTKWSDAHPSTQADGVERLRENTEFDQLLRGGVKSLIKQAMGGAWQPMYGGSRPQDSLDLDRALMKCLVRGYRPGLGSALVPSEQDDSDSDASYDSAKWRERSVQKKVLQEKRNPAGEERFKGECAALYVEAFGTKHSHVMQHFVAKAIGRLADDNRWTVLNEIRGRMASKPRINAVQEMGNLAARICEETPARGSFLWGNMASLRVNWTNAVTHDG